MALQLGFSSVESLSHVQLFVTPWTAACQASLSMTNSWSLLKLLSIKSVMPSNHLILCRPLLLPPSIFPGIRVFSNESVFHIRCPKYWSCSFSINEYSGLISFRIDWLDLLEVQGTLMSFLQHHSSKASILWCSAFFRRRRWHPTPVLWPPDAKNWLIRKDPDAGKDWRWKEKGTTETKMVHWLNGQSLSKLQELVKDWEAWHVTVHGVSKSLTQLSNWTSTRNGNLY